MPSTPTRVPTPIAHPRRGWVVGTVCVLVLIVLGGWLLRAEFFLWRLRGGPGYGYAEDGLVAMGERGRVAVYRRLAALGRTHVGEYRSRLVHTLQQSRYHEIAERVGSTVIWRVTATQAPVDEALSTSLRDALLAEPDTEQRGRILTWLGEIDFGQQLRLFRDAFVRVGPSEQMRMLAWVDHWARLVAGETRAEYDPWPGLPVAQLDVRRAALERVIATDALPFVEAYAERLAHDPSLEDSTDRGADLIRALTPLRYLSTRDRALAQRLAALEATAATPMARMLLHQTLNPQG